MPQTSPLKNGAIIIEGHVQGLSNTRALGEAGVPVYVVDTFNCIARYSKYCRKFFRCPAYDSDALADFLIDLAIEEQLEGWLLMPSNDHAVLTLSRSKERLERYYKVITPGLEIIEKIYDKSRLLEVAQKAEVPFPGTYYANDSHARDMPLSFPVLIRGRFGLDFYKALGRKAFLANDIDELRRQLSSIDQRFPIRKTLTQELIPDDGSNKTVSFAAFCVNGEIKAHWMGEKIREHPLRFGTATFARSVYIKECHTQSVPLLRALDYTGICEVEYLKDPRDGEYKLIEMNARTWLWVGLAKACGVDFARIVYAYVNGQNEQYPKKYNTHLKWINLITDTFMILNYIKEKKLTFSNYLNSIREKKIHAVFDYKDPLPGLVFIIMLPYLSLRRNY